MPVKKKKKQKKEYTRDDLDFEYRRGIEDGKRELARQLRELLNASEQHYHSGC